MELIELEQAPEYLSATQRINRMTYLPHFNELIKKGLPKSKALSQALEMVRKEREEAEKKLAKIEKKRKQKEDAQRKRAKKQWEQNPPSSLASDIASAS